MAAGLVIQNPDDPDRATNSPKTAYQVTRIALSLVRAYGTDAWDIQLGRYQHRITALKERWDWERTLRRIPVALPDGTALALSPGSHSLLIGRIIDEFCPLWTRGGWVLYVGDTAQKTVLFDETAFDRLGISLGVHGKIPDVVVHDTERNWLFLIEAVTSHGPIDAKRHAELRHLFATGAAPLVFVTACHDDRAMAKLIRQVSWETIIWVADTPSHLIHIDGIRCLTPVVSPPPTEQGK